MPNLETIFAIASAVALPCWIGLAFSLFVPQLRLWAWRVSAVFIPLLFGALYALLIRQGFVEVPDGGFGSITQVRALFSSDAALVAGWLHYLAFDLFVGTWIVRTGISVGMPRILVLACLPLAFILGPVGLLMFLLLRLVHLRFQVKGVKS